jgi:hypothetical protein
VFKRDWTMCSKFVNYHRLMIIDNEHIGHDLYGYFRRKNLHFDTQ